MQEGTQNRGYTDTYIQLLEEELVKGQDSNSKEGSQQGLCHSHLRETMCPDRADTESTCPSHKDRHEPTMRRKEIRAHRI